MAIIKIDLWDARMNNQDNLICERICWTDSFYCALQFRRSVPKRPPEKIPFQLTICRYRKKLFFSWRFDSCSLHVTAESNLVTRKPLVLKRIRGFLFAGCSGSTASRAHLIRQLLRKPPHGNTNSWYFWWISAMRHLQCNTYVACNRSVAWGLSLSLFSA